MVRQFGYLARDLHLRCALVARAGLLRVWSCLWHLMCDLTFLCSRPARCHQGLPHRGRGASHCGTLRLRGRGGSSIVQTRCVTRVAVDSRVCVIWHRGALSSGLPMAGCTRRRLTARRVLLECDGLRSRQRALYRACWAVGQRVLVHAAAGGLKASQPIATTFTNTN